MKKIFLVLTFVFINIQSAFADLNWDSIGNAVNPVGGINVDDFGVFTVGAFDEAGSAVAALLGVVIIVTTVLRVLKKA